MRFKIVLAIAAWPLLTATHADAQGKSYDFPTDPPDQVVRCQQSVTVRSSRHCGGKPATIVGGCKSKGIPRKIQCH